ncbi:MAG: tetratricopeptide repeat protein, partial [Candidatus Eisenbacteria bacterium]
TEALIALHPESDLALLAISDIPAYAIDVPRSATFTKQSDVFLVRGPGGSGAETVTATVYGKFSIRGPDFLGLSQGVPSGAPGFRSDGALVGICFDLSRDGVLLDYLATPASIENLIAGRGEPVSLRDLTPPVVPAYQDPDSLAGLVFRGALLTTTERTEEARRFLQRALDRDPTNATAHFWMGKLFFARGRHEEAADAFRRAADIDPSFHLAWHMAGVAESQAGRYPQALEMYHQALEVYPESALTYCDLGSTLFRELRYAEAEDAFSMAIQLDPSYPLPYFNLAMLLHEQGRDAEAESLYVRLGEIDPAWAGRLRHALGEAGS